jgi:UDP-N-acetyl-2-amino-2-deoxyglucuronate dehydrogenase
MRAFGMAVIGCGTIGDFHLHAIRALDNAKLIGIAGRSEGRLREVAEREGCFGTTDYRELLRNPEVKVVCLTTNSGSHAAIGLEALAAGKHLLVEKPIAMTAVDADRMIEAARANGVQLSVVSQRRFEPQHLAVKRAVTEGGLGRLLLVEMSCPYFRTQDYYDASDWRGTLAEDGGALMNQGIHSIDLMLWLAGSPVRTVYGKVATQTHRMEAEDIGIAIVNFENGCLGRIMTSTSIVPGFAPELCLYGEKGTIRIEGTSIAHWTVPGNEPPAAMDVGSTGGGVSDPRAISLEYHRLQMQDFLDSLETGREPSVHAEDGKQAVRLIEAIYDSSKHGTEVRLGV